MFTFFNMLLSRGSPAYAGMDPMRPSSTSLRIWLPRLRGDGPSHMRGTTARSMAPPPTRGWTFAGNGRRPDRNGSPAYAGMDPRRFPSECRWHRLPRLRGDGPRTRHAMAMRIGAPPPTRGWTPLGTYAHFTPAGSPAYAGMDPCSASAATPTTGLPRLRGDGPRPARHAQRILRAPPPTRGWTLRHRRRHRLAQGSPAYAGMDRCRPYARSPRTWLPRLRGDGP